MHGNCARDLHSLQAIHDRYRSELELEPIALRIVQPEFLAWLSSARGHRVPLGELLREEAAILRSQGNDEVADDLARKSELLLREN